MPTILLRLLLVCNVVNSIIAYLLPKKLRSFLTSYYPCPSSATAAGGQQQPLPTATVSSVGLTRTLSSPAAADASDLDRVFRMFDRNGDGKITRVELTDSLEDLGIFIPERDLKAVIDRVDADGDGCVDAREFRELYEEIMGEKCGEGEREDDEEDMRDVFHVFDGNGDGYITVEELQSVLESLGILQGKSADDCRTMIRNVDVDGDGRVDYDEFKKMMRRGGVCAVAS